MNQMSKSEDTTAVNMLLRVLCCIKVPIEIPLLAKICGIKETKLENMIKNELKSFVFTFKKRTSIPIKMQEERKTRNEEKKGYEDEIDLSVFACITSPNLCAFDNPVDVHNDIVRILRRAPLDHYSLF